MLNLSPHNSVDQLLPDRNWSCLMRNPLPSGHRMTTRWLTVLFLFFFIALFLPWRQNIQSTGKVTTLNPADRPQTIQSTIAGRIEQWYVREGQLVKAGDTIMYLSEIKTDYFDPGLVNRTGDQVVAKESAIGAYQEKATALASQVEALQQEQTLKQEQQEAKIRQLELKLASMEAEQEQAAVGFSIAQLQFQRTDTLFQQGIKSRTDWEDKRNKQQEAQAKAVSAENKVAEAEQELEVARLELSNLVNEYRNKIAKAQSDRFSTLSDQYAAEGDLSKMQIQYENYAQRSQFYYIIAPQDCYITQVIKPGIGETVKEGESVVSIMPANFELAVEIFVRPMDLPLIGMGEEVRFIFDGWPAIVFSGWPDMSFGTYSGRVVAIDNTIGKDGLYRILVGPNPDDRDWPPALRPGSGAKGVALLNQVPVWYELWRQLNGFPPDYYRSKEDEAKDTKMKAPLKSVK